MADLDTRHTERNAAPQACVEQEIGRIVAACTVPLRKGDAVVKHGNVTEIFAMPSVDEAQNLKQIDCHFIATGVDLEAAREHKEELVRLLKLLPDQEAVRGEASYITVGAMLSSQELALQLFGLGEALELWEVITPEKLGITGEAARQMAGMGFVAKTGLRE